MQKLKEATAGSEVKVALIHAAVAWRDKEGNVEKLLALNEEAAINGAKIIVNPELAISGYSFSSRSEIASQAETIPGPVTERFAELARRHQAYIALGMPEYDQNTGVYYNAAAFIGPQGEVLGRARKFVPVYNENLWAAKGNLPVLVCDTAYGKVGVIVCADVYWYRLSRQAALRGAGLLLVLTNWPPQCHPPQRHLKARALENGCYLLASNRTGTDKSMDCTQARSYVINGEGSIVNQLQSAEDGICYGAVPLRNGKFITALMQRRLAARQPKFYTDISLDAYSYSDAGVLLQLPAPKPLGAAALQFRASSLQPEENRRKMLSLLEQALQRAEKSKCELNLAVFPELSTTGLITSREEAAQVAEEIPGPAVDLIAEKAREKKVYIVWGTAERDKGLFYNTAVLIGPEGLLGKYRKIHLTDLDRKWARPGENGFFSCDLPCARVGLLLGRDLFFPESAECLAKRGVDLLCVPSFCTAEENLFLGDTRATEQQLHLVMANQWGEDGDCDAVGGSAVYSYSRQPEKSRTLLAGDEGDEVLALPLDPLLTRQKKFLEAADYDLLLMKND
jgi:predicted amidohydrolase